MIWTYIFSFLIDWNNKVYKCKIYIILLNNNKMKLKNMKLMVS